MLTELTYTDEQQAILDFAKSSSSNLMIQAYAGCGKTATLVMIDAAIPGPHLLLCFNKSIATEAEKRVRTTTTVKTFNSIGHKIWADAIGKRLTLSKTKIYDIIKSMIDETPRSEQRDLWAAYDQISSGVNLARAVGYIPTSHAKSTKAICTFKQLSRHLDEDPDELVEALIDTVLMKSIALAYEGLIDFNDQVYMPALFAGIYPTFPLVLIDEYQDLSPVNHAMVAKLCKRSRQIGVGDSFQSIYGFRGASTHSMADAVAGFAMETRPLSVSFRCPSRIVANVHWRVPQFRSSRDGGRVSQVAAINSASDGAAIICRNNAPLIRAALGLLSSGKSVSVAGTDISAKLIKTMTKLGPESLDRLQVISSIDDWLATKQERGSSSAADIADCMKIFARQSATLGDAIRRAKSLFEQSGTISLMTGHKAKGLEFTDVYHLDSDLLKPDGQDPNVKYVIDTRSSDNLSYVYSEDK